jgi:hypothetical protein
MRDGEMYTRRAEVLQQQADECRIEEDVIRVAPVELVPETAMSLESLGCRM